MIKRSFGWAQDASNLASLRRIIQVLIPEMSENILKTQLIERYVVDEALKIKMIKKLKSGGNYPYSLLKGTSGPQMTIEENMRVFGLDFLKAKAKTQKGGRINASCTGIIQISLPAQTNAYDKPYQSDWAAESYLKLAISLGLLCWNNLDDTCAVTNLGFLIATASDIELSKIYKKAVMSYPPAVRILQILSEDMLPHTKFELGSKLGFIGEAGFDSLDTGYFLWCLAHSDSSSRKTVKANKEKTCDKYARMTCSILVSLGLVKSVKKTVCAEFAGVTYGPEILQAYQITPDGYDTLNNSYGNSSHKQLPRRVIYETLATAAPDCEFLRYRRANIINIISRKHKTLYEIQAELSSIGINASISVINNDINGLENIGLRIENNKGKFLLKDIVIDLHIRKERIKKPEITEVKGRVIARVRHIKPKFFELIDLAFLGGKQGQSNDFEELTAELLIDELAFRGQHLGGANRPDIAVYYETDGFIIDTKAYEKGFSITSHQRDEMSRYINDNQKRDAKINPNEWWKIFPIAVKHFYHLFVSSFFVGQFTQQLSYIARDKGENGAAITTENLLYLADELKSQKRKYEEVKNLMENTEILI